MAKLDPSTGPAIFDWMNVLPEKRRIPGLAKLALALFVAALAWGGASAGALLDGSGKLRILCSPGLQELASPLAGRISAANPGMKISVESMKTERIEGELSRSDGDAIALVDAMIAAASLKPLAAKGIVFSVNAKDGPDTLSKAEIDRIVSGKISDWSELGRPRGAFRLYLTNAYLPKDFDPAEDVKTSHDEEDAAKDAPKPQKNKNPYLRRFIPVADEARALLLVSQDPAGMAMTGLDILPPEGVKLLAVDDVLPSEESVVSGRYPFAKTIYVAEAGKPSPAAKELAAMILDEAFMPSLMERGCIPLERQEKGKRP